MEYRPEFDTFVLAELISIRLSSYELLVPLLDIMSTATRPPWVRQITRLEWFSPPLLLSLWPTFTSKPKFSPSSSYSSSFLLLRLCSRPPPAQNGGLCLVAGGVFLFIPPSCCWTDDDSVITELETSPPWCHNREMLPDWSGLKGSCPAFWDRLVWLYFFVPPPEHVKSSR